jgi:hypothetical protein
MQHSLYCTHYLTPAKVETGGSSLVNLCVKGWGGSPISRQKGGPLFTTTIQIVWGNKCQKVNFQDLFGTKCSKTHKNCLNHSFRAVLDTLCVLNRFLPILELLIFSPYKALVERVGVLFFSPKGGWAPS